MLRTTLLAAALFAASLSSNAFAGDYVRGRVFAVEPRVALTFGSLRHDGFRVEYEFGGSHYFTDSGAYPGPVILVPPPVRVVQVVPYHRHRVDHWYGGEHRGWRRGEGRGRHGRHGRHGEH